MSSLPKLSSLEKQMTLWFVILSCVVALLCAPALFAQTDTARLTGTVSDANGAVVSGATVTVTNLGTGKSVEVQTGGEGTYSIPALPPGSYKVDVKQAGFKTVSQQITLQTQQVGALDVRLEVGQVTENLTVNSDLPLVESASSNISDVVEGAQITKLPLNGRNFTQLATLVPGVTRGKADGQATGSGNQAETFRYNSSGGGSLSVNGLRPQNNNFLLDGVDNNESLVNTIVFFPPAEAIQEFRVDTNIAPAELGRAGGGVVNTSYRSGTNQFHGSAFEFLRNSALDANNAYFSATGTAKVPFKRNQFGGTIGGPILKDKLFFFGDYQGLRQSLPLGVETATVPTQLMRTGNFSELLTLSSPVVIKDPITGASIPTNILPPGEIIAPGQNYLNAFPLPNLTGADTLCALANAQGVCIQKNFKTQRQQIQTYNDFDVRLDWNITAKDSAFGRYSYGKDQENTTSRLPTLPAGFGSGIQDARPKSFALGETHTFGNNLINEFRFGWIYTELGFLPPFDNVPLSQNLGIPNANTLSILGGGALIGGNNNQIEYTGDYGPYRVPEQTWQFSDSVSLVKGNHTVKVGASVLRRQVNLFRPFSGKGFFNLFGDGGGQSPTGYEVSDLLAGFVNNYFVGPALGFSHTRNWETGYFVQDDWRVSRHLTLNLGLRYDLYTWPEEDSNLQANFIYSCASQPLSLNCTSGQLVLPGTNGASKSLINTDTNNFAPRIGFAYDLGGNGKTVLRGGFGIFYFLDRGGIDNQLAQNPPFSGQTQFKYTDGFRINLQGEAPNLATDPTLAGTVPLPGKGPIAVNLANPQNVSVIAYPRNDVNSSAKQWNIQLQHELDPNTSFSIGYVGSHGDDLMSLFNLNRQEYNQPSGVNPFPGLGNVNANITNGTSSYNSLQTEFRRRFSTGLQFTAAYTWSHTIDDSPGTLDSQSDHIDLFNFAHERASSLLDLRHRFVLNAIYELPFGRGKRWGNDWNGVEQAVMGGWQLLPILTLQTGMPFDVTDSKNQPNTRPDLIGGLHQINKISQWFDTTAFVDPASVGGVYNAPGTAPRDPFTGPAHRSIDLTISKNFKITERVNTEFRSAFYNLTNTPQFSNPTGDINNGNFGQVKGILLSSEREIEFALRITF